MLESREHPSEQDVNTELLDAVLKNVLGYEPAHVHRESQLAGQRPDFVCFRDDNELDLIAEGKKLGASLDTRPSNTDPATRIPKIQIENYLRKRPDSKHGVYGLLTNGNEWRVCRRINNDIEWFPAKVAKNEIELKEALLPLTQRPKIAEVDEYSTALGQHLLQQIQSTADHKLLLDEISPRDSFQDHQTNLVSSVEISSESQSVDNSPDRKFLVTITTAADDGIVAIADIYESLKETYLLEETDVTAGLAIATVDERGNNVCKACRLFIWDGQRLHTSNQFDPELPGTRVLRQLESLATWISARPNSLVNDLNAIPIKTQFYDELANWFSRTGKELNDLRHLVRILFTWFLKEQGVVPSELFEKHSGIQVHEQLVQLFTQTLSVETHKRKIPARFSALRSTFYDVPFLNGSLFNDDQKLLRPPLADVDYLAVGKKNPGLFTILKRYEWTLTEHDQIRSDTALDPSMIGSVFERFVAIAENVEPGPLARQPKGTYYTPHDLTDEMVSDALAYSISQNVDGIDYKQALILVHPFEDSDIMTGGGVQAPFEAVQTA